MTGLSDRQQTCVIAVLLVVATLAVYQQVRGHDFIGFDDDLYVTANETVQKGLTWVGVKWAFTTNHAYNWHPLVWFSHMLDWNLYGPNPAGHHFTSVIFHLANTLLLFVVLLRMTGARWRSAFVAALFALHPVHVESVAWVSERKDVLSTFFWLLIMWFYVRYAERPKAARYIPVMIMLALGLIAKQMLVTLPFALLLLDYWPLQRFNLSRKRKGKRKAAKPPSTFGRCFVEKLPLLALSAAASVTVFIVQSKATLVRSSLQIPMQYRIGNAIVAYAKYIVKMFCPIRLGILYPHPETNLPMWQVMLAAVLLLAISIAVITLARKRRWLLVGWLWYLGTLVPVIGIVQVGLQAMADRYTYIPLIGLFIIVTWGGAELLQKTKSPKPLLTVAAVTILLVLTALTCRQVSFWQNSIRLYKHTVAVTANNDILHYNLGALLHKEGKIDEAIEHWREAVRIRPEQYTIQKNLANLLTRQGKIDQAIEHYRQALMYRPNDKEAREAIRSLQARRNQIQGVEQLYQKANALAAKGNLDQAISMYQQVVKLLPNYAPAHNNLANTYFLKKELDKALAHYSRAVQINPNFVDAHYNMAVLLDRHGSKDKAIKAYQRVLQLKPDHKNAQKSLNALQQ